MNVVWANAGSPLNGLLGDFVSERLYHRKGAFRDFTAMGVADGPDIVAALIYHDYDREAGVIQVSGASDTTRWLTKPVLWDMFSFPFDQIGCQSVVMRVDPGNSRLERILTSYGFSKHILPRMRGKDRDDAIYILHDDAWRDNSFHRKA